MLDFDGKISIVIDWRNHSADDIKILQNGLCQLININYLAIDYNGYQIGVKSGSYIIEKIVNDLNQIIIYLNANNITWISNDVKFKYYIVINKILTIKDNKAIVING